MKFSTLSLPPSTNKNRERIIMIILVQKLSMLLSLQASSSKKYFLPVCFSIIIMCDESCYCIILKNNNNSHWTLSANVFCDVNKRKNRNRKQHPIVKLFPSSLLFMNLCKSDKKERANNTQYEINPFLLYFFLPSFCYRWFFSCWFISLSPSFTVSFSLTSFWC